MSRLQEPPLCPLPPWRQAWAFGRDPLGFVDSCYRSMGEVFSARPMGGDETWTFLCSPDAVRQMFRAPKPTLPAGKIHARFVGALFGTDSTFCLDGDAHRRRQRLMMPLLSTKSGRAHVDTMRSLIEDRAARWTNREVSLLGECHRISLDILVRLTFGSEAPRLNRRLADAFERFSNVGARSILVAVPALQWDLGPLSPWGRILRLRDHTRQLVEQRIAARRDHLGDDIHRLDPDSTTAPFLDRLLGGPDGPALDGEALTDELMNLLFAGHETTGTFLAWCLECIAGRPDVLHKVRQELDERLSTEPFEAQHVDQLPYLAATMHETFRYRPVGPFSSFRTVAEDFTLRIETGDLRIAAGTVLAYCFPIMAKRHDLFADPESFQPERFLKAEHRSQGLSVYEWTPFGGGGRVCTGRGLALVELQVALATWLRMVDFHLLEDEVRIGRCGHLLAPAGGLRARVRRRPGSDFQPMAYAVPPTSATDVAH